MEVSSREIEGNIGIFLILTTSLTQFLQHFCLFFFLNTFSISPGWENESFIEETDSEIAKIGRSR